MPRDTFLEALDKELKKRKHDLPASAESGYLMARGRPQWFSECKSNGDRGEVIASAVADLVTLRRSGLTSGRRIHSPLAFGQEVWDLLRDLELGANPELVDWSPFEVHAAIDVGGYTGAVTEPISRKVRIAFDYRMSQRAVRIELQRVWPHLTENRAVREFHGIGDRKRVLVRLVCLEMREASWSERLEEWNTRHPEWAFEDTGRMQSMLHDAEESLVNRRRGLAWYYSPYARMSTAAVREAANSGDSDASSELDRRDRDWERSIVDAGIRFDDERSATRSRHRQRD